METIINILDSILRVALTLFLFYAPFFNASAATCSSISRTNSSANSVLTSTKYNTDLNTAYTFLNSWDFGCGQAGTLESDALNTTDFAVVLNGIKQGCKVSYSDSNTLSVGKCILSVNGSFVKTTAANTVTWLCSGCSSESSSTKYFLYAKSGSSGTTLNLLISTTSPNEDGYDNSGNRVLASFYNTSSSNIEQDSITHYVDYGFEPCVIGPWRSHDPTWVGIGTESGDVGKYRRVCNSIEWKGYVTSGTATATTMTAGLPPGLVIQDSLTASSQTFLGVWQRMGSASAMFASLEAGFVIPDTDTTKISFCRNADSGSPPVCTRMNGNTVLSSGNSFVFTLTAPITAWQ